MNWLLLTILAIVARASYSIATKMFSNIIKVSPSTQAVVLTFCIGTVSLVISPFIGGISFRGLDRFLVPILLMVFSQAFGNILFFKAIKHLDTGTGQIAFSSILIWGAILSVLFLGSVFSYVQLLGILLLMTAIIVVQYRKGKLALNTSFIYMIIAAGLFAIFQVSSAGLSKSFSAGTYLILTSFGPSLIIGLLYFQDVIKDIKIIHNNSQGVLSHSVFVSVTSILYFIFSYLAYRQAPDRGVVVALLTTQVILSVLFGIVLLKETENTKRKLFAGALALLASVMIKSS